MLEFWPFSIEAEVDLEPRSLLFDLSILEGQDNLGFELALPDVS